MGDHGIHKGALCPSIRMIMYAMCYASLVLRSLGRMSDLFLGNWDVLVLMLNGGFRYEGHSIRSG